MSLLPIATSSYNAFRTDALNRASQGLGYNVDNWLGYQCWDLVAELWMNLPEFSGGTLWPKTGPDLAARECWTVSRTENAGDSFDLIYSLNEVKRGDVIVIDASAISDVGHIAFADEDYNGTTQMNLLGQNQVNPSPTVGHIPTVTNLSVSSFLGAFRLKEWTPTPTPSFSTKSSSRLPLILMTRRLLNGGSMV